MGSFSSIWEGSAAQCLGTEGVRFSSFTDKGNMAGAIITSRIGWAMRSMKYYFRI